MLSRLKTLKIHKYRGHKVFIRHLWGKHKRTADLYHTSHVFELLIPFKGNLHEHAHEISKSNVGKYAKFTENELKESVGAMVELGEMLVDDLIFQWAESNTLTNRIKRKVAKLTQFIKSYNVQS